MAIDIRIELIDGSIRTFSFSFLEITTGLSSNSGDSLTSTSGLLCLSTYMKLIRRFKVLWIEIKSFKIIFEWAG